MLISTAMSSERFYVLGNCQAQWHIRAFQTSDFNLKARFLSLARNTTNTASCFPWKDSLISFIIRLPNIQVQIILSSKNGVYEEKIVPTSACNSVTRVFFLKTTITPPQTAKTFICTSYLLKQNMKKKCTQGFRFNQINHYTASS